MAKSGQIHLGRIILQFALGLLLAVAGIWCLMGGGDDGVSAIKSLIADSRIEKVAVIAYGVIEILAGIFLVLALFMGDRSGTFGAVIMIVIMIVWILVIVLIDFLSKSTGLLYRSNLLSWMYQFAQHLIILGSIIYLRK